MDRRVVNANQSTDLLLMTVNPSHSVGEPKVTRAGKIPRHEALLKRTKPMLKPTTPSKLCQKFPS